MSVPAWLDRVLGDRAFVDLGTVAGREAMADAIISAIPSKVIAAAIAESAAVVLKQKFPISNPHDFAARVQGAVAEAIATMWADIARELGNNAAQSVLCTLEEP